MKKNNKKYIRIISASLAALVIVNNSHCLNLQASEVVNTRYEDLEVEDENIINCGNLKISYLVTSEWEHHQNIQLIINNPTDYPVYRWAFKYDVGGNIANIWNADIVERYQNEYTIGNKKYNNYIAPHSSIIIGYTVEYDNTKPNVNEIINCVKNDNIDGNFAILSNVSASDCQSNNGVITIKNTSDEPIYGWNINFKSETDIKECYHAFLNDMGNDMFSISCYDWNSIIMPGETLNIGVNANFNGNELFDLSDVSMRAYVLSYESEQNDTEATLKLDGFSEYGLNILSWDCDDDISFEIYRKEEKETEFTLIESVDNYFYYLDEEAEQGINYNYYVASDKTGDKSNIIDLKTSSLPSEDELIEEPQWYKDMVNLTEDYYQLKIGFQQGDNIKYVSKQLDLPIKGENGSNINWKSSDSKVINSTGNVIAEKINDFTPVKMIATISCGDFSMKKAFDIEIAPKLEIEKIEKLTFEDLAELNGGYVPEMTLDLSKSYYTNIMGVCSDTPVYNSEGALEVIKSLSEFLGFTDAENQLYFCDFNTSSNTNTFTFRQKYNNVPVIGRCLSVFTDKKTGIVTSIINGLDPNVKIETTKPIIEQEQIASIVKEKYSATIVGEPELVIYYTDSGEEGMKPYLSWSVNIALSETNQIIIDASNGNIIEVFGAKLEKREYKDDNKLLGKEVTINTTCQRTGLFGLGKKIYYLYDPVRYMRFYEASGKTDPEDWIEYVRNDDNWSDDIYDDAIAAEHNLALAYDYFDQLGWIHYGYELKIGLHYAKVRDDGTIETKVNNAYSGGEILGFGSGDGITQKCYAAANDVVAHELTHTVVYSIFMRNFYTGLTYKGESGAISEAYADIFGEIIDPKYDWLHGCDVNYDGRPNRDLTNPTVKMYYGDNWVNTSSDKDSGGVHTNSTVLSYAAYLMSQYDDVTKLEGIPKEDLAQIYFSSFEKYGNINPKFTEFRDSILLSIFNEYNWSDHDKYEWYKKKAEYAFNTVGLFDNNTITVRIEDSLTREPIKGAKVNVTYPIPTYNTISSEIGNKCGYTDKNGEVKLSEVNNINELTFLIDDVSHESLEYKVKVNPLVNYYTIQLESKADKTLVGTVKIADDDTDMSNNKPLSNCNVKLEKLTGLSKLTSIGFSKYDTTDSDGIYAFDKIPSGIYKLTFSKDSYVTAIQTIEIKEDLTKHNIVLELIEKGDYAYGYAEGEITDATNGKKVKNLTLNIYSGIYIGTEEPDKDEIVATIETDDLGHYITDKLESGNYTFFVKDNRKLEDESERYVSTSFLVKIIGGKLISEQNCAVSYFLEDDQLRIVLTWGSSPNDLDSHTYIYSKAGPEIGHIYYANKEYLTKTNKVVELDLDDTDSFGPETTTIYIPYNFRFDFYIHDFTNKSLGKNDASLINSGARVDVYIGNSNAPVEVYTVPTEEKGTCWKVFSYDAGTHRIQTHNKILEELPKSSSSTSVSDGTMYVMAY